MIFVHDFGKYFNTLSIHVLTIKGYCTVENRFIQVLERFVIDYCLQTGALIAQC